MSYGFTLYSIELKSANSELLWEASHRFADSAEIVYFDRKSGTMTLQFVSTANEEQVQFACDEFKKEVELGGDDRLIYKVQIIRF